MLMLGMVMMIGKLLKLLKDKINILLLFMMECNQIIK
jgi:hypothetical protein